MIRPGFRRPLPKEQEVLDGLTVRPIQPHEKNRGRHEHCSLRLEDNTAEQTGFVAPSQIGELRRQSHGQKEAPTDRTWPLITSAEPSDWTAAALLRCRRRY